MFEVGRILFGSDNYGLNGPDSDKDYKVLLCPDFEDLYKCHSANKADLPLDYHSDAEHYSVIDIRKFDANLRAGNINTLEMVFSTAQEEFYVGMDNYMEDARDLYRNGYLKLVFSQFFKTMKGLIFNSFDRYGLTPKTVSRAVYFCNFVEYLLVNDFRVDYTSWRNDIVIIPARAIRFDESVSLPAREQFEMRFSCLEQRALVRATEAYKKLTEKQLQHLEDEANALQETMKKFIMMRISFRFNV